MCVFLSLVRPVCCESDAFTMMFVDLRCGPVIYFSVSPVYLLPARPANELHLNLIGLRWGKPRL